jgi:hypothetical protein
MPELSTALARLFTSLLFKLKEKQNKQTVPLFWPTAAGPSFQQEQLQSTGVESELQEMAKGRQP